jgi:hypothetical protein
VAAARELVSYTLTEAAALASSRNGEVSPDRDRAGDWDHLALDLQHDAGERGQLERARLPRAGQYGFRVGKDASQTDATTSAS